MARPTKQGLEYFPVDTNFDGKVEKYLIEHGAVGLGVLIILWQQIYEEEGYYCLLNDDLIRLIQQQINVDNNTVIDCINSCVRREIFSQQLFQRYHILTSRGIQTRFFSAAKRKKVIRIVQEFLLIPINNDNNLVFVDINLVIAAPFIYKYNFNSSLKSLEEEKTSEGRKTSTEEGDFWEVGEEPEKEKKRESESGKGVPKKRPWPEGFGLTEPLRAYAVKAGIRDPDQEFENFYNAALASNYRYADWGRAWMKWCTSPLQHRIGGNGRRETKLDRTKRAAREVLARIQHQEGG